MSRIAIFTYSIFTMGGEQRVVIKIANELAKKHAVTLFTMDPAYKSKKGVYEIANNISVKYYHPYKADILSFVLRVITHIMPGFVYDKYPGLFKRAYYHDKYVDLMHKCLENNYDTVIVTAWQLSIILGMTVEKYGLSCRTIGWQHSVYESYFERRYVYLYKHSAEFKRYAGQLSSVVVLNEGDASRYEKELGIKCDVIYNPRSFTSLKKAALEKKCFITCGRISAPKRYDRLIEAFNIYSKKEPEWELVILGDGPLRGQIEKLIKKYDLGERVQLYGFTKDVIPPMLEASVFLLTSEYEGFPMCITEAYELGLPVIAFDIPAMKPLSRNGEAIIVDAFDIEKYAEEMYKLASDYDQRVKMQEKALTMADSLGIEEIAKKWEELIV